MIADLITAAIGTLPIRAHFVPVRTISDAIPSRSPACTHGQRFANGSRALPIRNPGPEMHQRVVATEVGSLVVRIGDA
jgi:hypothetical protein